MKERTALERDRDTIRRRLGLDRTVRADRLAVETPRWLMEHFGPRPRAGVSSALWDDAAARLDQHRTAFDITDLRDPLGPHGRWEDGAYNNSRQAARTACERLDHALGRDHGVDLPGMGLGRGL